MPVILSLVVRRLSKEEVVVTKPDGEASAR
jgi:hypothetical protein